MLEALSTPRSTRRTLLLLAVCAGMAAAAIVVGVEENPLGIALGFLSASALVLGFAHPWRTSRPFRRLIYASVVGFVALVITSNVLEATLSKAAVPSAIEALLNGAAIAAFLLCPAGFLVGVIGAMVAPRIQRPSSSDPPAA